MNSNSNEPKVTVIMSVYNVEKYLKKCINFVLYQTLSNIEIILVDGGFTDNYGKMYDEYLKDLRVYIN